MKSILPSVLLPSVACLPLFLSSCAVSPPGGGAAGGVEPAGNGAVEGEVQTGAPADPAADAGAGGGVTPYAPLVHSLGGGTTADGRSECSLSASAPSKSPLKRQQLQFAIRRAVAGGWIVQRLLVQTGASKSQAQLQSILAEALRKAGGTARGDELAKIGDIRFGGELRVTADGSGGAAFTYNPGTPDGNPVLTPEECAFFADLLSR